MSEREPLDQKKVLEKRASVVAGLDAARDLVAKDDGKGALALLAPLRETDPLGGAIALLEARAALAAGDYALALGAATRARASGRGRSDVLAPAEVALGTALEKLGRSRDALDAYQAALADGKDQSAKKAIERLRSAGAEETPGAQRAPVDVHVESTDQACKLIETQVRQGKVDLPSRGAAGITDFGCVNELTLDVETDALRHASALRVDVGSAAGSDRLVWVVLETAKGMSLYGPVATVFGTKVPGVVNDVVVDLQKIDVLPGGAPEIVTKIIDRRTLPDVALDEVVEVDETRAILLTTDRGGILPSREVVLSSRTRRARIDPRAKTMPHGFAMAQGVAQVAEYSMKVAWGGPNSMTLTRASGDAKPKLEGELQLFP